jgi:hypothetical protein
MNKAFVREPEDDGRAFCPQCGALGLPVGAGPLDTHLQPSARGKLGAGGWFCGYPPCPVAYFDLLGGRASVEELNAPVFPKNPQGSLCACFGFHESDILADVEEGTPSRIRELLARSQSPAARCATLAADGRCCMTEIKRLYMKLRAARG